MPKRRYVSENAIFSKSINKISVGAEATFYRLLSISDDYGVVPADHEELIGMINYRGDRERDFAGYLSELKITNLLVAFNYNGRSYLMFNPESFDKYQDHIGYKRTRSEHTGIKAKSRDLFDLERKSKNFLEVLGNVSEGEPPKDYSIKTKDESIKSYGAEEKNFEVVEIHEPEPEFLSAAEIEPIARENKTTPSLEDCILYFEMSGFSEPKKQGELFYNYYYPFERDDGRPLQDGKWKRLASSWNLRKPDFERKSNGKSQSSFNKRVNYDHAEAERSIDSFMGKIKAGAGNPG